MRKFMAAAAIAAGVILASMVTSAATPQPQPPFYDVQGMWAEHDVLLLAARNATHPAPSGAFYPDTPVTRAQVVGMLVRGLGEDADAGILATVPPVFSDIRASSYRGLVESAWELGWVYGYPDHTFAPDAPIRRDELAALLVRVLGWEEQADTSNGRVSFQDRSSIPPWARGYVEVATRYGIVTGYEDNTFRPAGYTTRAEAAALVARVLRAKGAAYDFAGVVTSTPGIKLSVRIGDRVASFSVLPGATVFRNLQRADLTDIRPGDEAYVVLDRSGGVAFIDAFFWDDIGAVVSVDTGNRFLQYLPRFGGGVRRVGVEANASIFRNGRAAGLWSLRPGDRLYLVFTAATGQARIVDAVKQDVQGTVASTSGLRRTISIRGYDGVERAYTVSPAVIAYMDGISTAWTGLPRGTRVIAALENGEIVYIEGEQ